MSENLLGISEDDKSIVTLDLYRDFVEYDNLITKMNNNARTLFELEIKYHTSADKILAKAIEEGVDFKKLYGGNNAATRKQYVDEKLADIVKEIRELKFQKDENSKKLGFIKRLIDMKIQLIKYQR